MCFDRGKKTWLRKQIARIQFQQQKHRKTDISINRFEFGACGCFFTNGIDSLLSPLNVPAVCLVLCGLVLSLFLIMSGIVYLN